MKQRLTVVGSIYCQEPGEQPVSQELLFVRELASAEQPWQRRTRIGEDWQPLETGWIDDPGMVVLANDEGRGLQTMPDAGQTAAISRRTVLVGVGAND